ncbi:MAG: DUF4350 domain-containing protein [Microthrixaceae bacterium]|nr:DUF4350 domain-containing protein [Microthrixaceae bacterium]
MASTDGGPWFYPDRVSVAPGDTVSIHASSSNGPCRLVARRIGSGETLCAEYPGIQVADHPIPGDADANGCGWPAAFTFTIGDDWPTGYIDLELVDGSGSSTHHFLCCRPSEPRPGRALLVLSTNTYHSYNYWGGANSYANVDQLAEGLEPSLARSRAIGRLSRMRPFAQGLLAPPPGAPRLVNMTERPPGEPAIPGDLEWILEHAPSAYDGSAGFLQKWEHRFVEWAEDNGYDFDFACDHDFEAPGGARLDRYGTVVLVGHSEYWSSKQRDQLEEFVDRGGNLAIFGGNTAYWKVRWEHDARTLVAHKWNGETDDELWSTAGPDSEATHLWSHPAFGRPEAELTGLSFIYGGYHRLAMCVARGSGAYTIYRPDHWALQGSDLYYGDQLGAGVPLLGYENDGCPIRFEHGLPFPDGGVGVPDNLEIIGIAPAALLEPPDNPFGEVVPPEDPETLARIAYGRSDRVGIERLNRGNVVMASFGRGAGQVFNVGATEWAHGLAAGDPFVAVITKNVLDRFLGRRREPHPGG